MAWTQAVRFGIEHVGPSPGLLAIWYNDEKDVVFLVPEQTKELFELLKKHEENYGLSL